MQKIRLIYKKNQSFPKSNHGTRRRIKACTTDEHKFNGRNQAIHEKTDCKNHYGVRVRFKRKFKIPLRLNFFYKFSWKMLWEPLPKDVVGASTQRCGGSLYPKMLWMPHGKWRVRRSASQGFKAWRPSCGGQAWWSGGQDVGVVPKGVAWGKRVIMDRVHGCFWTANIVPGQMTHFVASLTLDSAKSCVIQGASCTQRKVYSVPFVFSIPFVLSWGGSISPNSFLSSILLMVVMVVIVVVTDIGVVIVVTIIGVVVVIAIIGVVIVFTIIGVVVVVIVGGAPSIIKLSFVIFGSLHRTML
ncbi:hypothetical protein Tco_0817482 [Tanacetum coccineum]